MKILSILSLVIIVFVQNIFAQQLPTVNPYSSETNSQLGQNADTLTTNPPESKSDWTHLTINSNSKIEELLSIQKEESIRKGGMDGYRLQIYQGKKDEAYQIKARFLSFYPNQRIYVTFQTPDFKVRVGDFRTRSEAINLKYEIKNNFPNPFIVEDIINFPEL